jgi:copper chaperone
MKKVFALLLSAAIVLAGCNTGNKAAEESTVHKESQPIAAQWVEVVLDVEGMTCDGCENAIKAGVESLDGINRVESSHEEGWTKVKYDKNLTSLEKIEEKITETGYEVKGERSHTSIDRNPM